MKKISVFLVAAVLVAVTQVTNVEGKMNMEELRKLMLSLRQRCADSTGADPKIIDDGAKGIFTPDHKYQCYLKCLMETLKNMRHDEIQPKLMIENSAKMLEEDIAAKMAAAVNACTGAVTSSDPCEKAYQFIVCFYNTDSSVYAIP